MTNKIKINWTCSDGTSFEKEKDAEKYQNLLNKFNQTLSIPDYCKINDNFTEIIAKYVLSKNKQSGKYLEAKLEDWHKLYKGESTNSCVVLTNSFNLEVKYLVGILMQDLQENLEGSKND